MWDQLWSAVQRDWAVLKHYPIALGAMVFLAAAGGFLVADYIDSHELTAARQDRDLYGHCLETGILTLQCAELARNAPKPKPVVRIITVKVPVTDPQSASAIARLAGQLDEANSIIASFRKMPPIHRPRLPVFTPTPPPSSGPVTATGANGVAAGHIDTFMQNNAAGVPVKDRTACVAGLQKFYVAIDPVLYESLPKDVSDKDFLIWTSKANLWIQAAANWINESLGPAALSKLQDQAGISSVIWSRAANQSHSNAINLLTQYKANIKDMMLSNAWDDAGAKCAH